MNLKMNLDLNLCYDMAFAQEPFLVFHDFFAGYFDF